MQEYFIIKRDGREDLFDKNKISQAVLSAFAAVDKEISTYAKRKAENIADYIEKEVRKRELTVEEIQDLVEKGLTSTKRNDVAKAFILYRHERTKERERKSYLFKAVSEKLYAKNVQNQNANVDERSFGGRRGEAADAILKQHALDYCMSELARKNHLDYIIYTHDINSYSIGCHNCLSIPFDTLLENGFYTRQTPIRGAKSVSTAFQLLAVIFQLQSLQQFGGASSTHLDWTMVPYVRMSFRKHYIDGLKYIEQIEDKIYLNQISINISIDNKEYKILYPKVYKYAINMTIKELKQAVEAMFHNLNSLQSRSGNQLPFTSINFGTCTLPEGRMVTKALLEGSLEGVGHHHQTPVFPCSIFQCMKGINRKPGDPNYDLFRLALKSTAKRLYPNYVNCDWSGNAGYDPKDPKTYMATMGCRTMNGFDINGFGQLKDGRGNICPVTIVLPMLAMEAIKNAKEKYQEPNKDEILNSFLTLLDQKIGEAKDILLERFEYICAQSADSADFMYKNNTMAGYDGKDIRSALSHGTLAMGQIALAETLQLLIGKDHTTKEGMELAKQIEQMFKDKCAEYKKEYKLNFGVYYSPAENLCYTAMNHFKEKYGIIEKVSDKDYFTNSMHIPVYHKLSPFEKIDLESQLTGYSSAGCITYVELDCGMEKNLDGLETLVNYAMDKDIPYFAINIPNDTCVKCGYSGELNGVCPECGGTEIQELRRVTGYLSTTWKHFNPGKQKEVKDRFRHSQLVKH